MTEKRVYVVEVQSRYRAVENVVKAFVPESPSLREARDFQRGCQIVFGDAVEVRIWSQTNDRRDLTLYKANGREG